MMMMMMVMMMMQVAARGGDFSKLPESKCPWLGGNEQVSPPCSLPQAADTCWVAH